MRICDLIDAFGRNCLYREDRGSLEHGLSCFFFHWLTHRLPAIRPADTRESTEELTTERVVQIMTEGVEDLRKNGDNPGIKRSRIALCAKLGLKSGHIPNILGSMDHSEERTRLSQAAANLFLVALSDMPEAVRRLRRDLIPGPRLHRTPIPLPLTPPSGKRWRPRTGSLDGLADPC